ncbi:MAG: geranylgeranylglyceryl/heptaprenylglyceryl phosphate synthase [Bacteroidales bacterium]|nr:geranylgeranylglyceryl/heptaprenylglyceryl phosphate synthase [Bacteroidales bacterium]
MMNIYQSLLKDTLAGEKKFAVLIDPDKYSIESLSGVVKLALKSGIDYFFFGGSLLLHDKQSQLITYIKEKSAIPVVLFPGNNMQLNDKADAILLLSLISGRNPDMLIGRHVISAPYLKASNLEILSTGYMLIESGGATAVSYMSNTTPIPSNKSEIAVCTAMAGEMLGMKLIYLDAGSGAKNPVPTSMISKVKEAIAIPLIIGGGITTPEQAREAFYAGADIVVVGNGIESEPDLITLIAAVR